MQRLQALVEGTTVTWRTFTTALQLWGSIVTWPELNSLRSYFACCKLGVENQGMKLDEYLYPSRSCCDKVIVEPFPSLAPPSQVAYERGLILQITLLPELRSKGMNFVSKGRGLATLTELVLQNA